jgi:HAMP domain-containing protein
MTLRTRILLGYGYLIALLLLSVSVAALNSSRVAGNARQIRERNIDSLTLAVQMLEQLERQDSETLLGLLHPAQGTRLEEAEKGFNAALEAAMRLDEAGGGADSDALGTIAQRFTGYRKVRGELLTQQHEDALAAADAYEGSVFAEVVALKQLVLAYLESKKEALKTANEEASRTAVEGAVLLGVMVTLALLSLGFLSRSLQRDVLGRLLEVGHVTEAIAAGDRRRRVRDFYQDELGLVARQLNAALDRQHELESQMQGRLLEQRRVLVGLLNQWPTPAAMIGIDGEVVASTLTHEDEAELDRLTPRIRAAAKVLMTRRFVKAEELAVDIKASDKLRMVQVRALASGDNQISGWLATFVGEQPRRRADEDESGPAASAASAASTSSTSSTSSTTLDAARVREAGREVSGIRTVAAGSALLGPAPYEPSGMLPRPFEPSGMQTRPSLPHGSASLAPLVREASGPRPAGADTRFIAPPPREPSGFTSRPVVTPGGAHEVEGLGEGAGPREELSAEMEALKALAAEPRQSVTRTPGSSGDDS